MTWSFMYSIAYCMHVLDIAFSEFSLFSFSFENSTINRIKILTIKNCQNLKSAYCWVFKMMMNHMTYTGAIRVINVLSIHHIICRFISIITNVNHVKYFYFTNVTPHVDVSQNGVLHLQRFWLKLLKLLFGYQF